MKYRRKYLVRSMLRDARRRASASGIPFDIKESDIIVPEFCPVLGVRLRVNRHVCGADSPSLDRLVPARGYVRGNVIVVSHRANTLRGDATVEEIRKVAKFYARLASR